MNKCIHKCKWKRTGGERYSFPSQYEQKCESCGKTRWKERNEKIPVKKITTIEDVKKLWEIMDKRTTGTWDEFKAHWGF